MDEVVTRLDRRPEAPSDEAFCRALFAETRAAEIACLGGASAAEEVFLRLQYEAQQRGHRAQHPEAERSIVLLDGRAVGRIVIDRSAAAIRLVDVVLAPDQRGLGLGTRLLGRLIDEARAAGRAIELHVQRDNPARRLYARLGFVRTGGDEVYEAMRWEAQR